MRSSDSVLQVPWKTAILKLSEGTTNMILATHHRESAKNVTFQNV